MRAISLILLFLVSLAGPLLAAERKVQVSDDASLRRALISAQPGWRILIAPGSYRPEIYVNNLQGTPQQPIVIEGADPQNPPLFDGGRQALHFTDCAHLTLRNIAIRRQSVNGINIDDGGSFDTPSHHITLENIRVSDIGPDGNRDGIKLSGVVDLLIRDCTLEGWGGQAIDMVGCHRGLVENCTFRGKPGFSQHTGPQTKGGSSDIIIRNCSFLNAGQRAVNIGGSTGLAFFRPKGAKFEARNITVEGCRFVGSLSPIAFVGVDGAIVRYNTLYLPDKWVMRILQETTEAGFLPCRNGRFEHNLIVFRLAQLQTAVNIGPHTQPNSFTFSKNFWFCEDHPSSRPHLPTPENNGTYGIDPRITLRPDGLPSAPQAEAAKPFGADALPATQAP